jgi:hypothetical protein
VKHAVFKGFYTDSVTERIRVVLNDVPIVGMYHFKPEVGIG